MNREYFEQLHIALREMRRHIQHLECVVANSNIIHDSLKWTEAGMLPLIPDDFGPGSVAVPDSPPVPDRESAVGAAIRAQAEVDTDIAGLIRDYHRHITRPGWKERCDWDSFQEWLKDDLNRLCSEPTSDSGPHPAPAAKEKPDADAGDGAAKSTGAHQCRNPGCGKRGPYGPCSVPGCWEGLRPALTHRPLRCQKCGAHLSALESGAHTERCRGPSP